MANYDLVRYHVLSSIRAAIVESRGYQMEADRMRSQANLRLIIMSEEELRELSRILSFFPSRSPEEVYGDIKQSVEEHRRDGADWLANFGPVESALPELLPDH